MASEDRWIDLSEGDEFAGYRIERALGRGGMGVLYLAVEPALERRVALKLIAPEAAADEVFASRFAEESRIAASIEHPNVVPIYAAGEERGVPFIAMRYVSGSDLGRRLGREGRLEPAAAAALIAQVGNGLDAIHAAGLVHRDVKPANVLLGGAGGEDHAYITDFGVARNVSTESGLTQTGRFVGTLDYVAPEQISGGGVDARADVYALGCLLFKLLTGEVPYPRDTEAARLYAHLNDPPPAPSLQAAAVPMALDDVAIRAMSKTPEDRYPSAGDLGRAAEAALSGSAVAIPERTVATGTAATVEPETVAGAPTRESAEPPTKASRRPPGRRRLALAGGLIAAALAAVLVVALSSGGGDGDGSGGGAGSEASAEASSRRRGGGGTAGGEPQAARLTGQQLIARGDRACVRAQDTYREMLAEFRFRGSERHPDIPYAKRLVAISTRQLDELEALLPPQDLEALYDEYVSAQRRVHEYNQEALGAARRDDTATYREAFVRRDNESERRYNLARRIGFKQCSSNPS